MDIINYEFFDFEEKPFKVLIGKLIKQIRYYRSPPIKEFKAAIPEIKSSEQDI